MFERGCIQTLQCNKDAYLTGVTTHNKRLQRGLGSTNKTARVTCHEKNLTQEVETLDHSYGVTEPRRLRGIMPVWCLVMESPLRWTILILKKLNKMQIPTLCRVEQTYR